MTVWTILPDVLSLYALTLNRSVPSSKRVIWCYISKSENYAFNKLKLIVYTSIYHFNINVDSFQRYDFDENDNDNFIFTRKIFVDILGTGNKFVQCPLKRMSKTQFESPVHSDIEPKVLHQNMFKYL